MIEKTPGQILWERLEGPNWDSPLTPEITRERFESVAMLTEQELVNQMKTKLTELGELKKKILDKLEFIVVTEGDDKGIVLLSSDGATHYDEASKCQVYDHENFSPLGDALIELFDMINSL